MGWTTLISINHQKYVYLVEVESVGVDGSGDAGGQLEQDVAA